MRQDIERLRKEADRLRKLAQSLSNPILLNQIDKLVKELEARADLLEGAGD